MPKKPSKSAEPIVKRRCAIYTRKSHEEGLDRDFNSLEAQYVSASNYIESQRGEGWVLLEERYDDGGYSGGSMDRPALQRLLRDVEAGRIDCVVFYRLDRLTRSIADFATILNIFDRHNTTFASVSEQYTTATSQGRMQLNVSLTFSQFEREIAGDRIRDKIAAARRKGKYTGGTPILGYDARDQRLVVNEDEANLVRRIFERFTRLGSATELAQELNAEGQSTKCWKNRKGEVRGGRRWTRAQVYRALGNRKYLGEVEHQGEVFEGEHQAIVPRKLWDQVRAILDGSPAAVRGNRTRAKTPALLKGILRCASCDRSMGPTFTKKRGKTYRYYLCTRAGKESYGECPIRSVPAGDLEGAVMDQLRAVFRSPELIAKTYAEAKALEGSERERLERERHEAEARIGKLEAAMDRLLEAGEDGSQTVARRIGDLGREIDQEKDQLERTREALRILETESLSQGDVTAALEGIDPVWEELFPGEQARIVRLLVERVDMLPDCAEIRIRGNGLRSLVQELSAEHEEAKVG